MNKLAALSVLIFFSVAAFPLNAQDNSNETYLYVGDEILVVSDSEIVETIPLPQEAQNFETINSYNFAGLSPDLKYFVFVHDTLDDNNQPVATLKIADLENQTCCTIVEDPTVNGVEVIGVGVFNPDSTQVAISYNRAYFEPTEAATALVDLATGGLLRVEDTFQMFDVPLLQFEAWTDEGVIFAPIGCFPCGGAPSGHYMLWDTETNTITTIDSTLPLFGDRLDSTGEILLAERDESLPVSNADAMVGPFNVIIATDDRMSETTIIYHDPNYLELGAPRWVMNGEAYLTRVWSFAGGFVIHRDGTIQEASLW